MCETFLQVARLAGMVGVILTAASCNRPARQAIRLSVSPPETVVSMGVRVRIASMHRNTQLIAGTDDGGLLLTDFRDRSVRWLHRGETTGVDDKLAEGATSPKNHDRFVTALALSDDGSTLLSASGSTIVWWDLSKRTPIKRLSGPHLITGAVFAPSGEAALFSTLQGHVFHWRLKDSEAELVKRFSCGATQVLPERLNLPKQKRCPYGTFVESEAGQPLCAYAVTQLVRSGSFIGRACREGVVGLLDYRDRSIKFLTAGALRTISLVQNKTLLAGRLDAELRIYNLESKPTYRDLQPRSAYHCTTIAQQLAAACAGKTLRIWHWSTETLLYQATLSKPPVWMSFSNKLTRLNLLLRDGRFITYKIALAGGLS